MDFVFFCTFVKVLLVDEETIFINKPSRCFSLSVEDALLFKLGSIGN